MKQLQQYLPQRHCQDKNSRNNSNTISNLCSTSQKHFFQQPDTLSLFSLSFNLHKAQRKKKIISIF